MPYRAPITGRFWAPTDKKTLAVHPAVAPGEGLLKQPPRCRMTPQDASFSVARPKSAAARRRTAAACRGLTARKGNREAAGRIARRRAWVDADSSELGTPLTAAISPEGLSCRPWKDRSQAPYSPTDSAEEFFYPRILSKSHFYLPFKLRKARGKQVCRTRKPRAPAKFEPNR